MRGTYNLNGGLFQVNTIGYGNVTNTSHPAGIFNFTARDAPGKQHGVEQLHAHHGRRMPAMWQRSMPTAGPRFSMALATITATTVRRSLAGPGQLRVIDSAGGGTVQLGNALDPTVNTYTGGTTVLSGTLQVVNILALPNVGVLTVGGPGSAVRAAFDLNGTQQTTEGPLPHRAWSIPISTSKRPAPIC